MKVFIPFAIKDIGGTSTFATKFIAGLEAAGHTATTEFCDDYDILLAIVQCPFKYLLHAKHHGKKIVQRLDGTYYWSVSRWRFPLLNAKAAYIRHLFTDFTIYQSEYSRVAANHFLGRKRTDPATIIYNGVDLKIFSPTGSKALERDNPEQKIFLTASAFRRRDQIEPIVSALTIYKQKYGDNFKFLVIGSFKGEVDNWPSQVKDPLIEVVGKVKNHDLPTYERAADVFLFTHLNPPCPNNVIEALACGLPVCGIADGAMAELVADGQTGRLVPATGSGFWQQRSINLEQFADNIDQISRNHAAFSKQAHQAAEQRFSLEKMINQYVKVFETLLK